MYPNEDIKCRVGFLDKKDQSGTMLSRSEFQYLRIIEEFSKYYETEVLKKELENISDLKKDFYDYLDKRELEIKQSILKTREYRKVTAMQHALGVINYLRNGGLKYFLYYVMDNYPFDNYNLGDFISEQIMSNSVSDDEMSFIYQNGNVYDYNPYTHKVTFNSTLLILLSNYINGDRTLYNKVEKYFRLASKNSENKNELINKLPVDLRNIDIDKLNQFIKFLDKSNGDFSIAKDTIEFMKAFDQVIQGNYPNVHEQNIINNATKMLEDLFANKIRVREIERYRVLDYFRDRKNLDICRKKFLIYKYNFEELIKSISNNRMLTNTNGNAFYNENGFNLPNINLACEYLNGRTKNYHEFKRFASTNDISIIDKIPQELIGADISSLEKIVYYGKNRINNPQNHELDSITLDLEMLQAIGNYELSLKSKNIEQEVNKKVA